MLWQSGRWCAPSRCAIEEAVLGACAAGDGFTEGAQAIPMRPVPPAWGASGRQVEWLQHHPELVQDLEMGNVRRRPDEPE